MCKHISGPAPIVDTVIAPLRYETYRHISVRMLSVLSIVIRGDVGQAVWNDRHTGFLIAGRDARAGRNSDVEFR